MGRLYGFQRYHITFLHRFFFCVVEYKHDYFPDKSHLLLCCLSVFKGSKPDSLAVML